MLIGHIRPITSWRFKGVLLLIELFHKSSRDLLGQSFFVCSQGISLIEDSLV